MGKNERILYLLYYFFPRKDEKRTINYEAGKYSFECQKYCWELRLIN